VKETRRIFTALALIVSKKRCSWWVIAAVFLATTTIGNLFCVAVVDVTILLCVVPLVFSSKDNALTVYTKLANLSPGE